MFPLSVFPVFDAVIGLAFVYLLLSLICSAIREAGEHLVMQRSAALQAGLDRLLGPETARLLWQHPLIAALAEHGGSPSYIPPRSFSAALLDLVQDGNTVPERLRQALRALEAGTDGDRALLEAAIESWFNSAMESVSRAYRRHTHLWLAVIGIGVTISTNADSIRMISALLDDPPLRAALAQAGEQVPSAPLAGGKRAAADLRASGLPIGWPAVTRDNALPWKQPWTGSCWHSALLLIQWHWMGWLLTVAAITLGAPFWFDLLKRIVPVKPS